MLTELEVRSLKPRDVRYMRCDSNGLYLDVLPGGQKYWILRFTEDGRRVKTKLGEYPDMSLSDARAAAALRRRENKVNDGKAVDVTFGELAELWFSKKFADQSHGYEAKERGRLDMYLLPKFKDRAAALIRPPEIMKVCEDIEELGFRETAHRVLSLARRIFCYGVAKCGLPGDPTSSVAGELAPRRVKHMASLKRPEDVGDMMLAFRFYPRPRTRIALFVSAYTFLRPGEVRQMEWSWVDWQRREIVAPAEKTKMRRKLIIPMSRQVQTLLEQEKSLLEAADVRSAFVFPAQGKPLTPMSDGTVRLAVRTLGYDKDEMSAHGFRRTASTLLNEMGNDDLSRKYDKDFIERQLAHSPDDSIRDIYNEAEYLPARVQMMQDYADYLDKLAAAAEERMKKGKVKERSSARVRKG